MRELTLPDSGPKRKLLDAAEQLFAEKGFEAVSVRDVTQFVKMNVAAVNYHFGSREGMMTLVIMRYANPVNEERLARLDSTEKKWAGKGLPLEEIIDAFVRPLLGHSRKSELSEQLYYKLLGRIFAENGDGLTALIEEQFRQTSERFMRSFSKALPSIAGDELAARIHFMTGGLVHLLTHQEMLAKATAGPPTMEAALARFVRFAAAGLREGTEIESPEKKGPQAMFDF
jgi:AcrR family transcriptional regulator